MRARAGISALISNPIYIKIISSTQLRVGIWILFDRICVFWTAVMLIYTSLCNAWLIPTLRLLLFISTKLKITVKWFLEPTEILQFTWKMYLIPELCYTNHTDMNTDMLTCCTRRAFTCRSKCRWFDSVCCAPCTTLIDFGLALAKLLFFTSMKHHGMRELSGHTVVWSHRLLSH